MLSENTRVMLSIIGERTEELLGQEEKQSYLFEELPGPEIWALVSQSSDFSDEEIKETIDELLEEGLLQKKEVEETKNRLQGLTPSSSVWYKEKNTHYLFKGELESYLETQE